MANNVNEKTNATATAEKKTEWYSIDEIISAECAVFLGLHEKSGSLKNDKGEEIQFHNFFVYLAFGIEEESNTTNCYGAEGVMYKIKADDVRRVFGFPDDADWYKCFKPFEWLYKPVEVGYKRKTDSNGNLVLSSIKRVREL